MLNFFLSYSHKDSNARDELKSTLNFYISRGQINFWYDQELLAGDSVTPEIKDKMNKANIFVLLVSKNFMGSDYIINYELKAASEKFKEKKCRVIPIVLEDISLKFLEVEFGEMLNALPQTDAKILKPLNKWKKNEADTAWKIILTELEKIIFGENVSNTEANSETENTNTASVEGGASRNVASAPAAVPLQNVMASAALPQNNFVTAGSIPQAGDETIDDIKIPDSELKNIVTDYLFNNPDVLFNLIKQSKRNNGN